MQTGQLSARLGVSFSLVYRDKDGNVVQTVPVRGTVPLKQEQPHGVDNRKRDQQSRS